ncbi:putative membrane protein, partial [Selenomonas sp. FOBRC6]
PVYVGAAIVAVLAGGSVALGLGKLVDIIGRITPALLFAIVGMVFVHLVQHIDTLAANADLISSGQLEMTRVGSNWFMSGMSNGGYSILMLANFSAVLGAREDFKTLFRANVLSTVLLVVLNTIIGLSIMSRITDLYQVQIPNLVIVASLSPGLTTIFGVLIFVAVYTTACPLLWTAVARTGEEGSAKYKMWALGLAAIGFFFGMFVPYHMMLNYVYGLNGYIGFIVMALMSIKLIRMKFFSKGSES